MMDIALAAVANQSLFVQLDDAPYTIAVQSAGGVVTATISRADVVLVQGLRVSPGTPILPYRYMESGNFVLITADDDLPDFAQFGSTQFLVYVSDAELAALRA